MTRAACARRCARVTSPPVCSSRWAPKAATVWTGGNSFLRRPCPSLQWTAAAQATVTLPPWQQTWCGASRCRRPAAGLRAIPPMLLRSASACPAMPAGPLWKHFWPHMAAPEGVFCRGPGRACFTFLMLCLYPCFFMRQAFSPPDACRGTEKAAPILQWARLFYKRRHKNWASWPA